MVGKFNFRNNSIIILIKHVVFLLEIIIWNLIFYFYYPIIYKATNLDLFLPSLNIFLTILAVSCEIYLNLITEESETHEIYYSEKSVDLI